MEESHRREWFVYLAAQALFFSTTIWSLNENFAPRRMYTKFVKSVVFFYYTVTAAVSRVRFDS